jgi:hypothetical protein
MGTTDLNGLLAWVVWVICPFAGLGQSSGLILQRGWRTEGLSDYSNRSQIVSNTRRIFTEV